MIQNMSYFENDGEKNYIFGKDGVKNESKKQSYKFLGEVQYLKKFQALVTKVSLCFTNEKIFFSVFLIKISQIY